jgi:hypothetical protein
MPGFDEDRSLDFSVPAKLLERDRALDACDSESVLEIDVDRDLAGPDSLLSSDMMCPRVMKAIESEQIKRCIERSYHQANNTRVEGTRH